MNAHKQLAKLNKHSTVSALVLTVALLCGIVGLGLYSVMAEPNGGYKVSDLEVRQGEDRQWYAYEKGTTTKATTYYGVVPNSYGWWRVEAGKVNFKAHGVFYNDYGYWLVTGGKVNFKFDGFLELDNIVSQKNGSTIYSDERGEQIAKAKGKTAFWLLDDGCGLAPDYLRVIAEEAQKRALHHIVCPNPLHPEEPEAVFLPERRLAFLTAAATGGVAGETVRHVRLDSIPDIERRRALRSAMRADAKLQQALLSMAEKHLQSAAILYEEIRVWETER